MHSKAPKTVSLCMKEELRGLVVILLDFRLVLHGLMWIPSPWLKAAFFVSSDPVERFAPETKCHLDD